MEYLKKQLTEKTKEFMETKASLSHKRARLYFEMQQLVRKINNK